MEEEQYGKQRMDKSEKSCTTQDGRRGDGKQLQQVFYQRAAMGNGTVVTVWESRTVIGAFKRAVSWSPLLRGPSASTKEKKDRLP
jgi:hypothetical protein